MSGKDLVGIAQTGSGKTLGVSFCCSQKAFVADQRIHRQYVSYCIQTLHGATLMDVLYARARFDDLDLDTRSQWVGKGKKSRQLSTR